LPYWWRGLEVGPVRPDIDGPAVGELIFNNMTMMFVATPVLPGHGF
jgi:hypothetical protein